MYSKVQIPACYFIAFIDEPVMPLLSTGNIAPVINNETFAVVPAPRH